MDVIKKYLLNQLSELEAAQIERRYFEDADFLASVERTETAIITEYLDGKLGNEDRERFANIYLQNPELSANVRRIQAIRNEVLRRDAPKPRPNPWLIPILASVAVLVGGVGLWRFLDSRQSSPTAPVAGVQPPPALPAAFYLAPGILKGAGEKQQRIAIPAAAAKVRLVLELPVNWPGDWSVELIALRASGRRESVWHSTTPLHAVSMDDRYALDVLLAAPLLAAGDYLIQSEAADGGSVTYSFRSSALN